MEKASDEEIIKFAKENSYSYNFKYNIAEMYLIFMGVNHATGKDRFK